ncbi:immunoglobulin domain-containing protein [Coraliomargarita sp. SDUM461003]|uniref:Immunoglobulin domain-containing protein n=1 Tax=Thalassobacterium maritimum TaxID=3041265 RepID=A0ABU1AZG1_9BACT|nr:immunoglobulin domain-containing protein [Coraliomargarita sp. SDUM461003]MDQ8209517.1 immunoglobulin domain-containing protein [Coraliomargarita sp. SDUM461003]
MQRNALFTAVSLFATVSLSTTALQAAPDTVDTAFANTAGQFFEPAEYGGVASVLVQPDGKILFGSNEMPAVLDRGTPQATPLALPLTRFNPDGSVDNTFFADNNVNGSDSGIYYDSNGWPEVHALGLLSDGKIVAAGVMQGVRTGTYSNPGTFLQSNSIVRFNADGTIDTSFQTAGTYGWPTGGFNYIEDVTIQPDDKIIAVGGFGGFRDSSTAPLTTRYGIARLNVDGSVDTGFNVDPSEFGAPTGASALRGFFGAAALDASGKIYVTGYFEWGYSYPAPKVHVLARLFPDGRRDPSFNPTLPSNLEEVRGVVVEPDGKVVVLGQYESPTSSSWMLRLNPDGSVDPSFTLDPALGVVAARPLQRDPAGKYLLVTSQNSTRDRLVRILSDGSLDPTFNASSLWTDHPTTNPEAGYFSNAITAPNGKIYSGSAFDSVNGTPTVKLVAFEGDSTPAALTWSASAPTVTENAGSITLSVVRTGPLSGAASVQFSTTNGSAGAGDFSASSGTLNWADGIGGAQTLVIPITQDALSEGYESFNISLSNPVGDPIAGSASIAVTIIDDEALPVITSDPVALSVKEGEPATFSVGVSSPVPVTYQWQKDGVDIPGATAASYTISATNASSAADYSVVVSTPAGSAPSGAARLTVIPPAAQPDAGVTLTGVSTPVSFEILTDGSLLMLDGNYSLGYTLRKIDGSSFTADPGFSVTVTPESGYGASSAYPSPIPLPNGQFLVTGFFSEVNGSPRRRLARMHADGTLDTSFVPFFNSGSFPVNEYTGYFNGLSGVHVGDSGTVYALVRSSNQGNRLFRLLADGSADPDFSIAYNYSTNSNFTALQELPDGSILIGYTAGGYGSLWRGIRRVLPDGSFDPDFPHFTTSQNVTGFALIGNDRFAAIHGNLLTIHNLEDGALLETHTFTGTLTSIQPYRGRLLLTGATAFSSIDLPGLALFSLDGTVDDNFPGGAGPNGVVTNAHVDDQERILVSGSFTTWNGVSAAGFTRLLVERPEVGFALSGAALFEDEGSLSLELVRYGDHTQAASVRVRSVDGTAVAPADFTAIDQTISWAAGDASSKTVSLTLVDDAAIEGDEDFSLQLSDVTGGSLVSDTLTVTLYDDDSLAQITEPPVDTFAVLGQSATLSVTATSPSTMSYQWYFDGQPIASATDATYNIPSVAEANEGSYSVRISNDYGSLDSDEVSLTIIPDPAALVSGYTGITLNSGVVALDAAPDGSVIIVGGFTDVGGHTAIDYVAKVDASGNLDTNFVPAAIASGSVHDVALQDDGKVVIVGSFYTVGGLSLRGMARLNADGSLDTDFASNIAAGTTGAANAVDILSDGRIVFGGSFTSWNNQYIGAYSAAVANADGSYAGAMSKNDSQTIRAIKALPDGGALVTASTTSSSRQKVYKYDANLVGQSFTYSSGRTRVDAIDLAPDGDYLFAGNSQVLKINPDGSTDQSASLYNATEIAAQINGKYIAAGTYGSGRTVRYLSNGTVDPSFSDGTGFNSSVQDLAIRTDGKVWVGGNFTSYNGSAVSYLALLNGDPIPLALTVQPAALMVVDPGEDVTLSAAAVGTSALSYQWFHDGDPLVDGAGIAGSQSASLVLSAVDDLDKGDYTVVVSNEAGTRTSEVAQVIVLGAPQILSLSEDVSLLEGSALTLEVEALGAGTLSYQWYRDGTLLPTQTAATLSIAPLSEADAGSYTVVVSNSIDDTPSAGIEVEVLANAAAIAPGFTPPTVTGGAVNQVLPLPNGRVLVGGHFTSISDGVNTSGARLAVVDETGAVIPVAGLSADGSIESLRLQADGKILLAGGFNNIGSSARGKLARLNADLSLDTVFNPAGLVGSYYGAFDIAEEVGGTIIAVGSFTDFGGETTADYAVRLNDDGSYNSSFTSGASSWIYRVFPQADGKLIFSGWFGAWGGSGDEYIARTDASGAQDSSIDYNTGFFYTSDSFQLANGDLLAAYYYGNNVLRLSSDGSAITPFPIGGNIVGTVRAFAESPAGDIYIGGNVSSAAGLAANGLIRLDSAGNRDVNFDTGTGFDNYVNDLALTDSGRIWAGGEFTTYNGITASKLVLLKGSAVSAPTDPFETFVASLPANQQGEDDDADGDGWANLVEFLFGTAPDDASAAPAPLPTGSVQSGSSLNSSYGLSLDTAKSYRVVEVEIPVDLQGLSVTLEASQDLSFSGDASATEVGTPTNNGSTEIRRYVITPAIDDAAKMFWRLKVSR